MKVVIKSQRVITTPFADDFNLMTGHKLRHQTLQDDLQSKTVSMGLTFKPNKCRSLSICAGKPTKVDFTLLDHSTPVNPPRVVLKSLQDDPHKFLGQTLTFKNSAKDHFQFIYELLENKLKNLDEVSVRPEYKIATYSRYLISSLRYHFSIHTIHKVHLDQLDMLANKYLKNWSGIPTRGCTNLSIFHPYLMGIKTPSQLYMEGHAGNYLICKVKADHQVNFALESQLSRESQWVGKFSTVAKCQEIYEKVSENMMIPTPENCHNHEASLNTQLPKLKEAVRQEVQFEYLEMWNSRIQTHQ